MTQAILVMVGGSLGALSRYGISLLAVSLFGTNFPWGTLIVNLSGSFLIGLALSLAERHLVVGPAARLFFVTGFLGALTTFSTYALETVAAARTGAFRLAFANLVLNNLVGLFLVLLGWRVGKFW
ncbi:MAG: fluoride efflux transporter CrcB [Candidatus Riflebacteria bacterium]|nr:fluoride efflux transporter CrcB [Candidatus Riflebacteria bacterium]